MEIEQIYAYRNLTEVEGGSMQLQKPPHRYAILLARAKLRNNRMIRIWMGKHKLMLAATLFGGLAGFYIGNT